MGTFCIGSCNACAGETVIEVRESVSVSSAPQQQMQQPQMQQPQQQMQQPQQMQQGKPQEVNASGFPKLEQTKEKLLKEIKRVVAGPNGERKVITYSQEEAAKLAEAGEELIEEEAELFYQEMLAEAEAEMTALEGSLDTFSEMTMDEDPPQKLISFANEAADFLEKLMAKVTGIACEVAKPTPKFVVTDEEYLKLMEQRVADERRQREEQKARDKKARRVGFGANVDVREFEGEGGGDDDDIGSKYGSEFSDSSDGSSMYSEGSSMYSEVPEGWEWSEEHQDYIFVGGDAGSFNMQGEEGGKKGTYVYVEGVDGAEGQYYFVPEGEGGPEFNKEIAGKFTTGAKSSTVEQRGGVLTEQFITGAKATSVEK